MIGVAIGSHNRDGSYPEYREIIVMQLEHLKSRGELEQAQQDPKFKPLYHLATDFTWHSNCGYRADIAGPECYIDLAEFFRLVGVGRHQSPRPEDRSLTTFRRCHTRKPSRHHILHRVAPQQWS